MLPARRLGKSEREKWDDFRLEGYSHTLTVGISPLRSFLAARPADS